MARVDPDNDDIRRYVLWRYAYDPQRHERRNQIIAACDNEREFKALFDQETAELERRRTAGEGIDRLEHGISRDPRLQQFEFPACGTVLRALRRLFCG